MDEEIGESAAAEPNEPAKTDRPRRSLSTGRIIGIALAVVVGIGLLFGAMSWFSTAPDRIESQERMALEKSWDDAQAEKAMGVDFELELRSTGSDSTFELSFDHSGTVTATDGCYQSSSDYIVLNDGSLALRDLSSTWNRSDGGDCDGKPSELFWAGRLSFSDGSWQAKDARGSALSPTLEETPASLPVVDGQEG